MNQVRSVKTGRFKARHGWYGTRLYRIWGNAKSRCNDENNKDYKYYGSKGIKMCQTWEDDFVEFKNWSIRNGYDENLTIDRIDNKKGYNPKNCQWISMKANAVKRNGVKLNKQKVEQIKKLIKNKIPQNIIADQFKIHFSLVSKIKHGKCWR